MAENTPRLPKFSKSNNYIHGLFKEFQEPLSLSSTFNLQALNSSTFKEGIWPVKDISQKFTYRAPCNLQYATGYSKTICHLETKSGSSSSSSSSTCITNISTKDSR